MKENNTKNAFEYLDDLEYVYDASVFKAFGKCWIDKNRFVEAITNARDALTQELEKARKIEIREQKIYEEAEKKKEEMIRETEEMIANLDPVKEAELFAQQIVEKAQEEAERIHMEALETRDNTISHGEKVKNELINQGHQFLENVLKNSLITYEENQKLLFESLESHREKLIVAYEEIAPIVKADNEETPQAS